MTIYEKRMNALNEAIARRNARNPYRKEPIKITKRCERCGEWFEGYMEKYCEECKKAKVKEDSRRYWEKVRRDNTKTAMQNGKGEKEVNRYINADKMIEDTEMMKTYIGGAIMCDGIIKYINEHAETGVETVVNCKNCDYWRKYEDSAQGRCVLLGISPTGAWYCADGRKQ